VPRWPLPSRGAAAADRSSTSQGAAASAGSLCPPPVASVTGFIAAPCPPPRATSGSRCHHSYVAGSRRRWEHAIRFDLSRDRRLDLIGYLARLNFPSARLSFRRLGSAHSSLAPCLSARLSFPSARSDSFQFDVMIYKKKRTIGLCCLFLVTLSFCCFLPRRDNRVLKKICSRRVFSTLSPLSVVAALALSSSS
jgi:hypothetical protein